MGRGRLFERGFMREGVKEKGEIFRYSVCE
jgi:hypothetical protein